MLSVFPGDWTLDITPVTLEDDAEFQCQVGAAEDGRVEPIRSRYATLTVLVPPTEPRILHPSNQPSPAQWPQPQEASLDLHKTVEGRMVELVCESRGGKPAAEVSIVLAAFSQKYISPSKKLNLLPNLKLFLMSQYLGGNCSTVRFF